MPVPIIRGYSRKVIEANISALLKDGYGRNQAIKFAFNAARASYFKAHPAGALPVGLAYPKDKRTAKYYTDNGAPIVSYAIRENPVRPLDMSQSERKDITDAVQKQLGGTGSAVRKSAHLYTNFTGHEDVEITKIKVPQIPDAVVAFGTVDGILYSTVRDGVAEKYIHKFKAASRPLLCASPDGKQLYLIGGSYDFTDRGIVDS